MGVDQSQLEELLCVLRPHCAGFHLDVMDNIFVPNTTWDADAVNDIVQKAACKVWVHLMVEKPELFYEKLILPVDSIVSFHIESNVIIFNMIKRIREKKHRSSVAISPKTPISKIFSFASIIDQILIMSVEPGFSGQPFLPEVLPKIDDLARYRREGNFSFRLGIDGGVNKTNIGMLAEKGVDDFSISAGIFNEKDPIEALHELASLAS